MKQIYNFKANQIYIIIYSLHFKIKNEFKNSNQYNYYY